MASESKKRAAPESGRPAKRSKADQLDPTANPYLAHMYDGLEQNANGAGPGKRVGSNREVMLHSFERHKTTAEQAEKAENGPDNPFNGRPLSSQYFRILETRRNLPVHQQR